MHRSKQPPTGRVNFYQRVDNLLTPDRAAQRFSIEQRQLGNFNAAFSYSIGQRREFIAAIRSSILGGQQNRRTATVAASGCHTLKRCTHLVETNYQPASPARQS